MRSQAEVKAEQERIAKDYNLGWWYYFICSELFLE